jgi:dTDP-4-dehydrorhamnose reductase
MRVLLTGANGMLGHALRASAPTSVEVVARTHVELDVGDETQVEREIRTLRPDFILNTGAFTSVDRAESEAQVAERTNGLGPGLLARAAARIGAKVVHFSTDHVFDGDAVVPYAEDASKNPVNAYGRSKLAGETALIESGARHLIIRTQWLFGPSGHSFPSTMWIRAMRGVATRVVNDQTGSPTFTEDLAFATWSLLEQEGILHVVNEGIATWYDVARRVFLAVGSLQCLEPCATIEFPTPARRPAYSVLSTVRLREFGLALPPWQESLDRYIAQLAITGPDA